MALRVSGIDLILKGYSSFISQIGQSQKEYGKLGKEIEAAQRKFDAADLAYKKAGLSLDNANRSVISAQTAYNKATAAVKEYKRILDQAVAGSEAYKQKQFRLTQAEKDQEIALDNLAKAQNNVTAATENNTAAENRQIQAAENVVKLREQAAEGSKFNLSALLAQWGGTQKLISVSSTLAGVLGGLNITVMGLGAAFNFLAGLMKGVVTTAFNAISWAANTAWNALKGIANLGVAAFKGVIGALEALTKPLRDFITRAMEVATGMLIYNFFRSIAQAVRNLVAEVVNAVVAFQKLEIQLSALAARDFARTTGQSMAEAFKATTGAAAELFDWIRKLAITTPFTVEEIGNMFAMAQAMGLNMKMSKDLTLAIVNFTSAMGLSGEVLQRIIYNFGQMVQRGKLSGEEFRDLSRNFVPIDDILSSLAVKAGMTKEAFRKLAMEGGVPVEQFLQAFIDMANKDFPDAAERMSRTLAGVTSNIKEFFQSFLGLDVLKPVADKIAGIMADALTRVTNDPILRNSTKLLGEALLAAFNVLIQPVNALQTALTGLWNSFSGIPKTVSLATTSLTQAGAAMQTVYGWAHTLAVNILTFAIMIGRGIQGAADKIKSFADNNKTTFGELIAKATNWGLNFIGQFAKGIALGMDLLAKAISGIASFLAKMFKPGSPPLIAPDIDQWGADTLNEWIKGFSEADFSMFDDVASLVESFFRSMGDAIAETDLIPKILEVRVEIARWMDEVRSGQLSAADATAKMVQSIGVATDQFSSYITTLFQVAEAEKVVDEAHAKTEAAQKALSDTTQKYDTILAALHKTLTDVTTGYDEQVRLREISEAMSTQLLTADERERLEMEKKAIETQQQIRTVEEQRDVEVAAAQAKVDAAKAVEESAKAQLDLLKQQATAQAEQIKLMIDQNNLIQDQIDLLKRLAESTSEEATQPGATGETGKSPFEQLSIDIGKLIEEANAKADEFSAAWNNLKNQISTGGITEAFNSVKTSLGNLKDTLFGILGVQEGEGLLTRLGRDWQNLLLLMGADPGESTLGFAARKITEFTTAAGEFSKKAEGFAKAMDIMFIHPAMGVMKQFAIDFSFIIGNLVDALGILVSSTPEVGDTTRAASTISFIGSWIGGVGLAFEKMTIAPFAIFSTITRMVVDTIAYLIDKLVAYIDVLPALGNFFTALNDFFNALKGFGPLSIPDALGNLQAAFKTLSEKSDEYSRTVNESWSTRMKDARDAMGDFKQLMFDTTGYVDGFRSKTAEVKDPIIANIAMINSETYQPLTAIDTNIKNIGISLDTTAWKIAEFTKINDQNFTPIKNAFNQIKAAVDGVITSIGVLTESLKTLSGVAITVTAPTIPGKMAGGPVQGGMPYIVGERRPEVFVPPVSGTIVPSVSRAFEQMVAMMNAPQVNAPMANTTQNIDRSIHVEVNPTYSQVQSEASLLYDIEAALASARY